MVDLEGEEGMERKGEEVEDNTPSLTFPSHRIESKPSFSREAATTKQTFFERLLMCFKIIVHNFLEFLGTYLKLTCNLLETTLKQP